MKLAPSKIRTDGGTQPRAQLQREVIEDYAEQMKQGVTFPPLAVFFDGKQYWLADGFHRLSAWIKAFDRKPIAIEVIQGTKADAQWYSLAANRSHGLRRTNFDKARAVKAALRHPQGAEKSDRQIAEHVGVHFETVAKYRKDMQEKLTIGKPDSRTGRDGRTINTRNIGRAPARKKKPGKARTTSKPSRPILRRPSRMAPMTALSLPHDPEAGARTLIEVFDTDYLRKLHAFLSTHLEGTTSCA